MSKTFSFASLRAAVMMAFHGITASSKLEQKPFELFGRAYCATTFRGLGPKNPMGKYRHRSENKYSHLNRQGNYDGAARRMLAAKAL